MANDFNKETQVIKRVSSNKSQRLARRNDPHLIQIPGEFFPHANFQNALWLRMQAIELRGQHTGGRGGSLQLGRKHTTFKFLAPEQIIETHNHDWEEYASIQSRILEKVIGWKTGIEQWKGVKQNLETAFKNTNGWPSGERIANILAGVGDVRVPRYKIDTPLKYMNSQRREYQFNFILADNSGGAKIVNAVQSLQNYAAPFSKGQINIDFPYIFSVNTEPEGLIKMNYAALTSILATWQTPYIEGKPVRCELTLSFKDMSPLFRKTLETGSIVNINTAPREPRYTESNPRENNPSNL